MHIEPKSWSNGIERHIELFLKTKKAFDPSVLVELFYYPPRSLNPTDH